MLSTGLHALLGSLGLIWLIIVIPVWLAVPGVVFALFMLFCFALTALLCVPLNLGSRKVKSQIQYTSDSKAGDGEEWVFVNGICTGKHWLQGMFLFSFDISTH